MRMLAPLLLSLVAAAPLASIDGLPIGALPRQSLPASGCAAYLFTTGATRAFAAMATANGLTLAPGGTPETLARTDAAGQTARGFPASATFAREGLTVTLAMTVADRSDLTDGSTVPTATLTLVQAGKDSVIVPLAGLVACRT